MVIGRNPYAAIVLQFHRALGHKLAQRLAHRHGADVQLLRQPSDGQRLARLDPARA